MDHIVHLHDLPIAKTGDCLLVYEKTLTLSDGTAYADGDNLGELLEISNATNEVDGTGEILSFELIEYAPSGETLQKPGMEIYFQKTTFTSGDDNAAFSLTTPSDYTDVIGIPAAITATTDYTEVAGTNKFAVARKALNVKFQNRSDTTLYARLIATGAPNFDITAGVRLIVRILIQRN